MPMPVLWRVLGGLGVGTIRELAGKILEHKDCWLAGLSHKPYIKNLGSLGLKRVPYASQLPLVQVSYKGEAARRES